MCSGIVARRAAIFPMKLCRSILEGVKRQMIVDRRHTEGAVGIHCVEDVEYLNDVMQVQKTNVGKEKCYYDDITGQPLDPQLVEEARRQELACFFEQGCMETDAI